MNVGIITKDSLEMKAQKKIDGGFIPRRGEMIDIVTPFMSGLKSEAQMYDAAEKAQSVCSPHVRMSDKIKQYGGVFHVPRVCQTLSTASGKAVMMSVTEMISKGLFNDPKMSANTLPADWQSLWDATRIEISIQRAAIDPIRGFIYSMQDNPGASKVANITELFEPDAIFEEINGEGQSVNQMETRGGQTDTVEHFLYAVGFTRTLIDELYNNIYNPEKISRGVARGYNAKQDDLSISPILNFSFAGVPGSQTPADTTGSQRQEKLYNTLENAIDHLGRRFDPVTEDNIVASDLILLSESEDARHEQRVVNGLTDTNVGGQDTPKILPSIPQITNIVAYNNTTLKGRVKDVTYQGVTRGKSYLIKRNRYMFVSKKRGLTLEADMTPDVATLAREKRSWYFGEGQYTEGIQYFIQEITLPAYTPATT